jgi:hypothetical protein
VTLETYEGAGKRSGNCAKSGVGECASIVGANDLYLLVAPAMPCAPAVGAWDHVGALKPHSAQKSSSLWPKLLARQGDSGIKGERLAFRDEVRQRTSVNCGAQALQITLAQITFGRID